MKITLAEKLVGIIALVNLFSFILNHMLGAFFGWGFWLQLVVFLLVSTVFSGLLGRRSTKALQNLVAEVKRNLAEFAAGNFTAEIEIDSQDSDVAEIKDSFANLRRMLNIWVQELLYSTVSVGNSAKKISDGARDSGAGMEEVASSLTQLRKGVETTAGKFMEVAAATEELASVSQSIAANTTEAADQAKGAESVAEEGGIAVRKAVAAMEEIQKSVEESSNVIGRLADVSKEIGYIVSTISAISEQTNLLALNAAIEAARAGEHGRGFAVVAEEVRKLADESNQAAGKIDELIRSIQNETQNAVNVMEKGSRKVGEGVQVAMTAGQNLDKIVGAVRQMVELMESVTAGIKEQAQAADQIAATTEEVAGISQESNASIQEISATFEQQVEVIHKNSATAEDLTKVAQKLEDVMQQFDNIIGEQMMQIDDVVAQILRERPLANSDLREIAKETGLSEIHITDENGKIAISTHDNLVGFQFKYEEGAQTNDFLPILKDRSLRVNQKTRFRDLDDTLYKYAAVSRLDQSGIVECGLEASQITGFRGKEALERLRQKYLLK